MSRQTKPLVAQGSVGLVDAALVRWLIRKRMETDCLLVRVIRSQFEALMPRAHLESFLAALEVVDGIMTDPTSLSPGSQDMKPDVTITVWPETELSAYSLARICKQVAGDKESTSSPKLTTLENLQRDYGTVPRERDQKIGIVSGSFDVIHPGHICLMQTARQQVDVLVVLTMSSISIRQQEKNSQGDRPIYNEKDRLEVLSALRAVDHIVVFDDLDCQPSLQTFCPNFFIKSASDQSRPVVQAEAAQVNALGGKTIYLKNHHPGYSSSSIIHYVRQQACR